MCCPEACFSHVCTFHPAHSVSHGISSDSTIFLPSILSAWKALPNHWPANQPFINNGSSTYSQCTEGLFLLVLFIGLILCAFLPIFSTRLAASCYETTWCFYCPLWLFFPRKISFLLRNIDLFCLLLLSVSSMKVRNFSFVHCCLPSI